MSKWSHQEPGLPAISCLNVLVALGAKKENIWVTDIEGVVYEGRTSQMDRWKAAFARRTEARRLDEVMEQADVFLGLSAGGVLKPEMLEKMAPRPLVLALANPIPEIMPDLAHSIRDDLMMCTGRSDYPNQVNNVLCFPYIFRGALDVGATAINEDMKLAAVTAIADLARAPTSEVAAKAYGGETMTFGPESLIPTPFDPRLILKIAPAVAKAAMESGVATRPIEDFDAYHEQLNRFVFRSGLIMKPIFSSARSDPKRVIYAEGEDERVLRAAQVVIEEGIAQPILVGRPEVIQSRLERFGIGVRPNVDFEVINPESDPRYRDYVDTYLELTCRQGVTPDRARTVVRTRTSVIAMLAVRRGDADAMLCGLEGRFSRHVDHIRQIIGLAPGVRDFSALSLMLLTQGAYFLADTHVSLDPSAEEIAGNVDPRVQTRPSVRYRTENRPALSLQFWLK